MIISKEISIEELTENLPESIKYLMNEGIRCIVCGEPIWGSLEEAALEKGFSSNDIERFIAELQAIASSKSKNT
ncbi:MAG: DUF1858 domain-containing protein [Bacteroidetes bacterium CG2_30_33_31]|nr:MAG: DUF1858 domain-containing protein [Bacteroidetes bacterium CG2_30_33_31]